MAHPDPLELRYDLKKPCNECPFRAGAKYHEGVTANLMLYHGRMEQGTLVFTCHKTDRRSDSPIGKKFRGKIQHCGGLLTMMAKDVSMLGMHQCRAMESGKWKPERMDLKQKVFKNFYFVMKHYLKLSKGKTLGKKA